MYYYRDTDGREVDFVLADYKKALFAIEVKWADEDVHKPLRYFKNKFPEVEAWQVHHTGKKDYITENGIRVAPVTTLLDRLV